MVHLRLLQRALQRLGAAPAEPDPRQRPRGGRHLRAAQRLTPRGGGPGDASAAWRRNPGPGGRARIVVWIAAAAVLALVAGAPLPSRPVRASSPGAPPPPPAGNAGTTAPAGQSTTPPPTSATGVTTTAPPAGPAPLVLVASGGDVWLYVRAGSATGKV